MFFASSLILRKKARSRCVAPFAELIAQNIDFSERTNEHYKYSMVC